MDNFWNIILQLQIWERLIQDMTSSQSDHVGICRSLHDETENMAFNSRNIQLSPP